MVKQRSQKKEKDEKAKKTGEAHRDATDALPRTQQIHVVKIVIAVPAERGVGSNHPSAIRTSFFIASIHRPIV